MMIICNIVPEILCATDIIYIFHFGLFFGWGGGGGGGEKAPGDIIILHMCKKNYDRIMYDS